MIKNSEDRKSLKKLIIIMVIAMFLGGIFGFCSALAGDAPASVISTGVSRILKAVVPLAIPVVVAVCWIVYGIFYQKSKRLYRTWNGEEEETVNRVEIWLSYMMIIPTVAMVVIFFVYACTFSMGMLTGAGYPEYYFLLETGFYALGVISIIVMQYQIVDFEKRINPEKRGSVFDIKFAKKWEDSCDEAERLLIYKSAYQAYQAVNYCCIALWVFCAMGSVVWQFGVLPVTMVSIIWLVLVLTYSVAGIRLSKKRINE